MESTLGHLCTTCFCPLDVSLFRRRGRPRLDGKDSLHSVCLNCRRAKDEIDWCALCEARLPHLDALAEHMKKVHKRLILDQDINKQTADRRARLRALQEEEELFA